MALGVFWWSLGCSYSSWGVPVVFGVFQGDLGCSYNPWGGLWGVLVALYQSHTGHISWGTPHSQGSPGP